MEVDHAKKIAWNNFTHEFGHKRRFGNLGLREFGVT
jgi:hypothetical protein